MMSSNTVQYSVVLSVVKERAWEQGQVQRNLSLMVAIGAAVLGRWLLYPDHLHRTSTTGTKSSGRGGSPPLYKRVLRNALVPGSYYKWM